MPNNEPPVPRPWKTLSSRTILDQGQFLKVELHKVELPDGRVIDDWAWVVTPDYINVVAQTDHGTLLFFRQTKYCIDGVSLAPVGGYINDGETPLEAARRELIEETGYEASSWESLGSFPVDGNRGAGTAHFFLATHARQCAVVTSDDLEEQYMVELTLSETSKALRNNQFRVLPWVAVVALAMETLNRNAKDSAG